MKRTHVANIEDVKPSEMGKGKLGHRLRRLGAEAGGKGLGCSYIEVEPGMTGFPNHWHSALEEAVYILEGQGTLRLGDETIEVRTGDYIALLPGPQLSHAIANTGSSTLRYLAISGSANAPTLDILGYPDSKKLAFASGVEPGTRAWQDKAWVMKLIKEDQPRLDYYDNEPLAAK
jgi:uncharacterized cupin superfamily protein